MKIKPAGKEGCVTLELDRADERLMAQAERPTVEPLKIARIVVPIDFSPYSYKSLDYASAFATQSQAEVLLLHVVPLNYVDTELIAFDYAQLEAETAKACEARLEALRRDRVPSALRTEIRVRVGRPVDEIVNAAKEFDADLIVMSTHGYTGIKHAFLGSTTENVVRYAPCPVLTLREHEHDFVPCQQQDSAE